MRLVHIPTKTLILCLVLRMFAAPLALPEVNKARPHAPLTARLCKWTAQRPARQVLVQSSVRRRPAPADAATRPTLAGSARAAALADRRVAHSSTPFADVHVSVRARC